MKKLMILRHATPDRSGPVDRAHPLTPAGEAQAARLGHHLRTWPAPSLVVASSATRAHQTAAQVIEAAGWDVELQLVDDLYLASAETAIGVLSQIDDRHDRVLYVGHEPTCSSLVSFLTGQYAPFSTASLASLSLLVPSWGIMVDLVGTLTDVVRADDLPEVNPTPA